MNVLVLPIVTPLLTAVVLLLAPRRPLLQRWISLQVPLPSPGCIELFIHVEAHGFQVLQAGGWPAPFGITLVADFLTAMLVVATGMVGSP